LTRAAGRQPQNISVNFVSRKIQRKKAFNFDETFTVHFGSFWHFFREKQQQ
jgi:hypothetical protein